MNYRYFINVFFFYINKRDKYICRNTCTNRCSNLLLHISTFKVMWSLQTHVTVHLRLCHHCRLVWPCHFSLGSLLLETVQYKLVCLFNFIHLQIIVITNNNLNANNRKMTRLWCIFFLITNIYVKWTKTIFR
jgi:hypothetical protein